MRNVAVRKRPVLSVCVIIAIIAVFVVFLLYPVARDYYVALRENSRLSAEYEAVLDRNEKIQQRIDELNTPEGIEDWARQEFGWVREGEKAVNITGLLITESSLGLPFSVEPGTVKAPDTWWTEILDRLFGVESFKPANPYPDDIIPGL